MFTKYLYILNFKTKYIQMSHVIVLSDSDESDSSIKNSPVLKKKNYQNDSILDDFEFPAVQFDYIPDASEPLDALLQVPKDTTCFLDTIENNKTCTSTFSKKRSFTHDMSDSSDSELCVENVCISQQTQVVKKQVKKDKNKLIEERLTRKKDVDKQKALKKITAQKLKDISPGECMKFITVILDEHIKEYTFHSAITKSLDDANILYNFISHSVPKTITWERKVTNSGIDENNKIYTKTRKQTEKHIIIVWYWNEVVEKLIANSFCTTIFSIRTLLPDYNMTLIMFGLKGYFTYHEKKKKSQIKKGSRSKTHSKSENFCTYKESPEISKKQLDSCLAEIQIISRCNNRLIENPEDLALIVYQYTKAVAEIPYKLETNQCDKEFNWYVAGDNRDTVSVDKSGNGLKRLWQQQLCQFNSSSLEIAEAICTVYKSPAQLIKAYKNCTPAEGSKLLKDLPIRRAAGPLTSIRRVGPELSKKVYIMFTSENGDALLGNSE